MAQQIVHKLRKE